MKRQAGREVCRLLAWVCLEGDKKAGRQGGLQVVGVGMLRGRLLAMKRQAGREVCRLLAWVCLEGDEKQVVGVCMVRGR